MQTSNLNESIVTMLIQELQTYNKTLMRLTAATRRHLYSSMQQKNL